MKLQKFVATAGTLLCTAAITIPVIARAPRPPAPPRATLPVPMLRPTPLSGTGAPYMRKMAAALRNHKSVRLTVHLNQSFVPKKGKMIHSTASVEVAWIVPSHLYYRVVRPGAESLEVGNPTALYQYIVGQKSLVKRPASQIPYFMYQAQRQINVLMPPMEGKWTYSGVHSAMGHPCDLLVQKDASALKNVWLDRVTHLPRQVTSSGAGPAGSGNIQAEFPVFEVDHSIPASLFQFTPPRGVKVIVPPAPPAVRAPRKTQHSGRR